MDDTKVWIVIAALSIGSFLLRFSFLGLIGDRGMPEWLMRHLRYTAVAILPAMVTPLLIWPTDDSAAPVPERLAIAGATLAVGYLTKNVFAAMGVALAAMVLTYWV